MMRPRAAMAGLDFGAWSLVGAWLLVAATIALQALPSGDLAGSWAAAGVFGLFGWLAWFGTPDRFVAPRAALVAGVGVRVGLATGGDPALILVAGMLLVATLADPAVAQLFRVVVAAHNLAGVPDPVVGGGPFARWVSPLGVLLVLWQRLSLGGWLLALLSLVTLVAVAGWTLTRARGIRVRGGVERVGAALRDYRPRFAVYFSGKPDGAYQVAMWLPYLERTGCRYLVIVRDEAALPVLGAVTEAPVVFVRSLEAHQHVMVDSLGAVFYVNNEPRNVNGVRFLGVTHVHLGHGDSDKPASYSPTFAMFDRVFVAGQAAIDRFAAHGVMVPQEKFVIVGRPQAEAIECLPDGSRPSVRAVLYAPTWRGGLKDMALGSLGVGEAIVAGLLSRGVQVWFRPHPYSWRDPRAVAWIAAIDGLLAAAGNGCRPSGATATRSITECFNATDALVTDVSSVATDYLATRKPLAIVDLAGDSAACRRAHPVARVAYLLSPPDGLAAGLDALLGPDPLAGAREAARRHYLGDAPADGHADLFVAAAREAIDNAIGRARRG